MSYQKILLLLLEYGVLSTANWAKNIRHHCLREIKVYHGQVHDNFWPFKTKREAQQLFTWTVSRQMTTTQADMLLPAMSILMLVHEWWVSLSVHEWWVAMLVHE